MVMLKSNPGATSGFTVWESSVVSAVGGISDNTYTFNHNKGKRPDLAIGYLRDLSNDIWAEFPYDYTYIGNNRGYWHQATANVNSHQVRIFYLGKDSTFEIKVKLFWFTDKGAAA